MTSRASYCPRRGDLVWVSFGPALVLSPEAYNRKVGLALLCPITSQVKDYPFEVALPEGLKVSGVILADAVKSLDWKASGVKFACAAPDKVLREVLGKLGVLVA